MRSAGHIIYHYLFLLNFQSTQERFGGFTGTLSSFPRLSSLSNFDTIAHTQGV